MDGRPEAGVLDSNMPVAIFFSTSMLGGRGIGALVQQARAHGTGGLASALGVYAPKPMGKHADHPAGPIVQFHP